MSLLQFIMQKVLFNIFLISYAKKCKFYIEAVKYCAC